MNDYPAGDFVSSEDEELQSLGYERLQDEGYHYWINGDSMIYCERTGWRYSGAIEFSSKTHSLAEMLKMLPLRMDECVKTKQREIAWIQAEKDSLIKGGKNG